MKIVRSVFCLLASQLSVMYSLAYLTTEEYFYGAQFAVAAIGFAYLFVRFESDRA